MEFPCIADIEPGPGGAPTRSQLPWLGFEPCCRTVTETTNPIGTPTAVQPQAVRFISADRSFRGFPGVGTKLISQKPHDLVGD